MKPLYFAAILITFMLSGCDNIPKKTVEVKIPVPVYTKCPVEIPPKPETCSQQDTRVEWLRCALIERERLKAYSLELEAQLRVCSE